MGVAASVDSSNVTNGFRTSGPGSAPSTRNASDRKSAGAMSTTSSTGRLSLRQQQQQRAANTTTPPVDPNVFKVGSLNIFVPIHSIRN
jgi:hypothetical protein